MSIDKDSNGLPEVDLHRRTTKVNLFQILAIGLFILAGIGLLWWVARQHG
ncbi:MAG TPA: hypothetical protein VL200_06475 [Lacunisphaera sp.]|nr:hypothetical protein [Lacunisphaera sp.]